MDDPQTVELEASLYPQLRLSAFSGRRTAFSRRALAVTARNRVGLVLAGHVNYAPLCLLLKRLRPQMRFGVFLYGCEVWEPIPSIRRWAVQQADFFISISAYTKQQAVNVNKLQEDRIFLLPNALEWRTAHSNSNGPYSLPQGMKLLSVGRLDNTEQRKGFDTVIQSMPLIAEKVPNVQYIVIGNGTDLERHKRLAASTGVSNRVHFFGSVDEELLRACYQSCDVFVMPSAQEGFGFVYLEAMQFMKPVVAANSGGAPEVVDNGVTGRLVRYDDREQLAGTLTELLLDSELRRRLGQAGYQRLQYKFTFAHFKERLTEILQRELAENGVYKFARPDQSASCVS
jgi:phosphatidyl-myo-inositol dimannoside synthase